MRLLDGITGSLAMSLSKPRKIMKDREAWRAQSMGLQRVGHDLVNEQQKKTSKTGEEEIRNFCGKEQVVFITDLHFIVTVIYSHCELINTRKLYFIKIHAFLQTFTK